MRYFPANRPWHVYGFLPNFTIPEKQKNRKMKRNTTTLCLIVLIPVMLQAQKPFIREFTSPEGNITLKIEAGTQLAWSVTSWGKQIIEPSPISMTLQGGEVLGSNARPFSPKIEKINTTFNALNYRKNVINDICTQVTLGFRGNYGVIFRIYDDAVAYRFFTKRPGELVIMNEEANFNFSQDYLTFVPIQWDYRDRQNFNSSFEALYREINFLSSQTIHWLFCLYWLISATT
jgi:alpha-glucosidase